MRPGTSALQGTVLVIPTIFVFLYINSLPLDASQLLCIRRGQVRLIGVALNRHCTSVDVFTEADRTRRRCSQSSPHHSPSSRSAFGQGTVPNQIKVPDEYPARG